MRLAIICFLWPSLAGAAALPGDWGGPYEPCDRHDELLNTAPLRLRVRFSTDEHLTRAFTRALNFWATVLDLEWRREDGRECSIHVFNGDARLFLAAETARAQFPDRSTFQGWVAFNPKVILSEDEQYLVSVHELGHLFGLSHNPSPRSIMFFLGVPGPSWLDAADIEALAARHRLRASNITAPMPVSTGESPAAKRLGVRQRGAKRSGRNATLSPAGGAKHAIEYPAHEPDNAVALANSSRSSVKPSTPSPSSSASNVH